MWILSIVKANLLINFIAKIAKISGFSHGTGFQTFSTKTISRKMIYFFWSNSDDSTLVCFKSPFCNVWFMDRKHWGESTKCLHRGYPSFSIQKFRHFKFMEISIRQFYLTDKSFYFKPINIKVPLAEFSFILTFFSVFGK